MAHGRLYRNFLILQEEEKRYSISSDKPLSGYTKVEGKGDKCKISFYAQNLKKDNYHMMLICNKKGIKQNIVLGTMNINEQGRAEVSTEYNSNDIANSKISIDKVIAAAIVKFMEGDFSVVMVGLMSGERLPQDWRTFHIANIDWEGEKKKSEEIVALPQHVLKSEENILQELPAKIEAEAVETREHSTEAIREQESEEQDTKLCCQHEATESTKLSEESEEHKVLERTQPEEISLPEEEAEEEPKLEIEEEKIEERAQPEEISLPEEEAEAEPELEIEEEKIEERAQPEEISLPEEEAEAEPEPEIEEEKIGERAQPEEISLPEEEAEVEPEPEIEEDKMTERTESEEENLPKKESEVVLEHKISLGDYVREEKPVTSVREALEGSTNIEHDFDEYEKLIEASKAASISEKGNKESSEEFVLRGSVARFFEAAAEGFEEVKGISKEIKYCKWYRVKVENLDTLCQISDYNKYTIAYYPMMNYYPYFRRHGHFLLGYKCDASGSMKYLIYGVPGRKTIGDQPYGGKSGFVTWTPLEGTEDFGYWLKFYDFKNSVIVVPMK